MRQVLIRRDLRAVLKRLAVQARVAGTWTTLKTVGNGNDPLPRLSLVEVAVQRTEALRLTSFVGTPSLYEVEVYEGPNPPMISLAW